MINGNTNGIKDYILKELETTCEEKIERGKFLKKDCRKNFWDQYKN